MTPLFTIELDGAEWVRVMRTRLDLTQAQLAKRLGVERRTIMRYETGVCKISQARMTEIMRLAEMTQ
ncbi:MAG TPA: helix-turn-helix transcriptional regulator [Candidatus Cybelea sp.]|nr:helix-turn-helix transcriptional regulator [Candidatus Cybelea sp.]